jgi:aspartyl-tRNA(Asn)/glutamyl-tRNA(Gln) amidotransferase subunit A
VAAAVRNAIERMAELGAILVDVALPDIVEVSAVARLILWSEASSLYERHRNPAHFGPDVWQLIEQGRSVAARDYIAAQKLRSVFRRKFDAVWREVDLIAAPATAITAPLVEEDQVNIDGYIEDARIAATRLARAVNLIGEPAVSLPCGQDANGLPVGLQLISKPFRGPWLLAVAEMLGSRWN